MKRHHLFVKEEQSAVVCKYNCLASITRITSSRTEHNLVVSTTWTASITCLITFITERSRTPVLKKPRIICRITWFRRLSATIFVSLINRAGVITPARELQQIRTLRDDICCTTTEFASICTFCSGTKFHRNIETVD